jgi:hypothetical protein
VLSVKETNLQIVYDKTENKEEHGSEGDKEISSDNTL